MLDVTALVFKKIDGRQQSVGLKVWEFLSKK